MIKIDHNIHVSFNFIKSFLLWCLYFGFLFEIPIISVITTRRIAFVFALIYLILHINKVIIIWNKCKLKSLFKSINLLIIPFTFLIINSAFTIKIKGNDYFEIWYFFYIIFYIFCFGVFTVIIFDSIYDFTRIVTSIMVFQSIVVYCAILSTELRLFLYLNFCHIGAITLPTIMNGSRVIGIELGLSTGSIIMLCALILLSHSLLNKKIGFLVFSFKYIFILGASAFIGRTGFYIGIVVYLYSFLCSKGVLKKTLIIFICLILVSVGVSYIFSSINEGAGNYLKSWIGEIFEKETRYRTVQILTEMDVPSLCFETIWGSTVMRGLTDSGINVQNDSGYIEIYTSLGLIGAIFYYISIVLVYVRSLLTVHPKNCLFYIMLISIMMLIEYKEPYILKYIYSYTLMVMLLFERKDYYAVDL